MLLNFYPFWARERTLKNDSMVGQYPRMREFFQPLKMKMYSSTDYKNTCYLTRLLVNSFGEDGDFRDSERTYFFYIRIFFAP